MPLVTLSRIEERIEEIDRKNRASAELGFKDALFQIRKLMGEFMVHTQPVSFQRNYGRQCGSLDYLEKNSF